MWFSLLWAPLLQSVVDRLVFTAEFDVRTVEKSWMSKNGLYLFLDWSFPRLTNHKDERDIAEVEDFKLFFWYTKVSDLVSYDRAFDLLIL